MSNPINSLPLEAITHRIRLLRGQKVLLDSDLATLYGVPTKRLNEQVKRNLDRFPADFMFLLTEDEFAGLRSQFATLNTGRGQHRKYLPYAFTEHGAIMASMILNSSYATEISVYVVRAFIQLREVLANHRDLAKKLIELERKTEALSIRHDNLAQTTRVQLKQAFEAIRELMEPPKSSKPRPIGFIALEEKSSKSKIQPSDSATCSACR
jgi:hypothetical protein